jgi:predicted phage tail protein
LRAIDIISQRRFFKYLTDKDQEGAQYKVFINGKAFDSGKPLSPNDVEAIKTSELVANVNNLTSIDIVPVLQGADSGVGQIIVGVLLVIVGIILIVAGGSGAFLIVAGIGLIASGIITLLSKPPEFEDFREIQNGGKTSYLFSGPQNTTNEGGPVPVGYGRLIVGSQVISASYEVGDRDATETLTT